MLSEYDYSDCIIELMHRRWERSYKKEWETDSSRARTWAMMIKGYSDCLAGILELMHRWVRSYKTEEWDTDRSQTHALKLNEELLALLPDPAAEHRGKDTGGGDAGRRRNGYMWVANFRGKQDELIGSHQWPVMTLSRKGSSESGGSSLPSGYVSDYLEVLDTRLTSSSTLASSADVVAAILGGAAFANPRLGAPLLCERGAPCARTASKDLCGPGE